MARGSKSAKEAKRRIVAKGKVAGKSTAAIAREAKASKRHVERIAAEPETQLLITDLMKPHRAKLGKLVEQTITAVSAGLKAKRTDMADHRVRLYAVRRAKDLLEMAQGKPAEETANGAGLVTWEEFVVLYRKSNHHEQNPAVHGPADR